MSSYANNKKGKYHLLIRIKKALPKERDVLFIFLLQREKLGRVDSSRELEGVGRIFLAADWMCAETTKQGCSFPELKLLRKVKNSPVNGT